MVGFAGKCKRSPIGGSHITATDLMLSYFWNKKRSAAQAEKEDLQKWVKVG
jgi:hypothetical protein